MEQGSWIPIAVNRVCTALSEYCISGLCPSSRMVRNTAFQKLDLFPSTVVGGWEISAVLGRLERAYLNQWATSMILHALYMYVSGNERVPQLLSIVY
jgi:hypothetical protein